jgi:hypothetical protein
MVDFLQEEFWWLQRLVLQQHFTRFQGIEGPPKNTQTPRSLRNLAFSIRRFEYPVHGNLFDYPSPPTLALFPTLEFEI